MKHKGKKRQYNICKVIQFTDDNQIKAKEMEIIETINNNNQILITNITWNASAIHSHSKKSIELPTQFALDLPENVINQANKKGNDYKDVIESFTYNFLTRKFDHEVYSCSIWLPLEND